MNENFTSLLREKSVEILNGDLEKIANYLAEIDEEVIYYSEQFLSNLEIKYSLKRSEYDSGIRNNILNAGKTFAVGREISIETQDIVNSVRKLLKFFKIEPEFTSVDKKIYRQPINTTISRWYGRSVDFFTSYVQKPDKKSIETLGTFNHFNHIKVYSEKFTALIFFEVPLVLRGKHFNRFTISSNEIERFNNANIHYYLKAILDLASPKDIDESVILGLDFIRGYPIDRYEVFEGMSRLKNLGLDVHYYMSREKIRSRKSEKTILPLTLGFSTSFNGKHFTVRPTIKLLFFEPENL